MAVMYRRVRGQRARMGLVLSSGGEMVQRILQPGQIEALAQRSIPRIRLPARGDVFGLRAARLRELADGHAIGDYLRLMAVLAEAQQHALLARPGEGPPVDAERLAAARAHGMPVLQAAAAALEREWDDLLRRLCAAVTDAGGFPPGVSTACARIAATSRPDLDAMAAALVSSRHADVDAATAPFVMAALQVCWVDAASRLAVADVPPLDVPGVCPVCGSLPVASIIRTEQPYQGYRFLHCGLCATEWHMVRVMCSQCQATKDIGYHAIEGASATVRAESCDACRTYRKILYREKDPDVEPVADDLASIALDLLMAEAGYHRGSGNPLLWQQPEA